MLPYPTETNFADVLVARRESLGMLRHQLAVTSGIDPKLIRRYEDKEYKHFAKPKIKNWVVLNIVLGFKLPEDEFKEIIELLPDNLKNSIMFDKTLVSDFKIKDRYKNSIKPIEHQLVKTNWLPCSPYYSKP